MKSEEKINTIEEREPVEQALLCALFLDKVAITEVIGLLRPEMFADLNHAFIYAAFVAVYNRGEQPDLTLVALEMKKTDQVRNAAMGGIAYISDSMDEIRLEHNARSYATEIKRRFMLERLRQLFKKMALESAQFGADYLTVIERCEEELLKLREDNLISDSLVSLGKLAEESILNQKERMNKKDDPRRILSGVYDLDAVTGGFYRGELTVLGGQPSNGKTALSMFMAMNAARRGKTVLHYSLEMTGDQTISRFFTGYGGIEADRMRIDGLRPDDLEKMAGYATKIKDLPYYFANVPFITLDALRAEILLKSRKGECDFVLIDYIQLLAPTPGKNETTDSVIGTCMRKLKSLSKEVNCPFLVVSQLNRDVTKRFDNGHIPVMSDLRDSGTIEQAADTVVIISRPSSAGMNKGETGGNNSSLLKLYMLKNRNGATGVAEVYHNATYTNFTNPDRSLHFRS